MSVPVASARYRRRVVDDELDALFGSLAAISIEGAKAAGKTARASQRARTVYELDEPNQRSLAEADLDRLLEGEWPVLIDGWQRVPASCDLVRGAVDDPDTPPASYLLTGSAGLPADAATHTAGPRHADDAARRRFEAHGVMTTSTNQLIAELDVDWSSETSSKLIQITFEEVFAHLDEMAAPAGVA